MKMDIIIFYLLSNSIALKLQPKYQQVVVRK